MPYGKSRSKRPSKASPKKRSSPYKKKASRSTTLKSRGRVAGNFRPTIQKGYLPFGREFFARLPYVENFALSADGTLATSAIASTFSCNNVFDPRVQVGGHQPLQYDSISLAYERVWVHGCKAEITFNNTTLDGLYVGYRIRANTNAITTNGKSLDYIQEMRESVIAPLNNSGTQTKKFTVYIPNHKILGITKAQYANLEYSHGVNTNPAVFVYIEPYALHTVIGETATCRCNVKLTYYCQFTNPVTLPQS